MYRPPHFQENDLSVLRRVIEAHPFATLVSRGPAGIEANHLPLIMQPGDADAPRGRLIGHLARPNQQAQAMLDGSVEEEVLAIFHGPHAYISPSWYPSKRAHGKVVPTWNYIVVHAYGRVRAFAEPERLREVVTMLTERHESVFATPWSVEDAPADFIDKMLKGIVGVEIAITRLEGKSKLSQNRPAADRKGVIEGLRAHGEREGVGVAETMAGLEPEEP